MHRRTLLKASAAALPAPSAAPAIAQGNAKVLRCAPEANLASIDPIWTTATVAINHGYMVYDTLYGTDLSLTPRPQMFAGHTVVGRQADLDLHPARRARLPRRREGALGRLHRVDRPLVQAFVLGSGVGRGDAGDDRHGRQDVHHPAEEAVRR